MRCVVASGEWPSRVPQRVHQTTTHRQALHRIALGTDLSAVLCSKNEAGYCTCVIGRQSLALKYLLIAPPFVRDWTASTDQRTRYGTRVVRGWYRDGSPDTSPPTYASSSTFSAAMNRCLNGPRESSPSQETLDRVQHNNGLQAPISSDTTKQNRPYGLCGAVWSWRKCAEIVEIGPKMMSKSLYTMDLAARYAAPAATSEMSCSLVEA